MQREGEEGDGGIQIEATRQDFDAAINRDGGLPLPLCAGEGLRGVLHQARAGEEREGGGAVIPRPGFDRLPAMNLASVITGGRPHRPAVQCRAINSRTICAATAAVCPESNGATST